MSRKAFAPSSKNASPFGKISKPCGPRRRAMLAVERPDDPSTGHHTQQKGALTARPSPWGRGTLERSGRGRPSQHRQRHARALPDRCVQATPPSTLVQVEFARNPIGLGLGRAQCPADEPHQVPRVEKLVRSLAGCIVPARQHRNLVLQLPPLKLRHYLA